MKPTGTAVRRIGSWRTAFCFLGMLAAFFVIGCVTGREQPHMEAALTQLQSAKTELQNAMADKGGHRARAIGIVDRAIAEVQAGIDYAASRY